MRSRQPPRRPSSHRARHHQVDQWCTRAPGTLRPGPSLGGEATASPVVRYAFRLFGVRTILLGAELLLANGPVRDQARRTAVLVHAADTTAAAWGAWRRELPPRVAMVTIVISAINTLLAVLARPRSTPPNGLAMSAAPRHGPFLTRTTMAFQNSDAAQANKATPVSNTTLPVESGSRANTGPRYGFRTKI